VRSLRSILVTGGAGFIGSSLVRHLLAVPQLEHLVVLDKLTYAGNPGNLIGPDQDPRFRFVEGDIGDAPLVARLLGEVTATGVFHLAAESHVDRSIENSDDFILTNVFGTSRVLDACRTTGVPLLHCSTDEAYGSIDPPGKFTEDSPLQPGSAYSASKASADLLCLASHNTHGQDVVITRCTNNYGPRQHDEKFIPTLVRHAVQDLSLPIYGDGLQIRDWIHVDDHCRGMIAAFLRGPSGHVFNFGGHCERTNLGIARTILSIFGKPESLISSVPDRPGHDRRYAIDTTKAEHYFAWHPTQSFQSAFPSVVRELAANYTAESFAPAADPDDEDGLHSRWAPPRPADPAS
jgi:dTDP-glucose 4,6-dehydratase